MTTAGPLVLLVEDEPQMTRFLRAALAAHGYRLVETTSGKEALAQATAYNPDLVLLDLGLPDMDGRDVVRALREWTNVPILVISARHTEDEKIAVLDDGADDYLTKPFGTGELLARLRVAERHAAQRGQEPEPVLTAGELRLDLAHRQVFRGDEEIHLTPNEYKLFTVLMRHAGKVLTHGQLLKDVWGPGHLEEMQYLRVYMAQLRRKLERDPARPRYLLTEPGVGYRLKSDAS